jgi:hypothetical protein
MYVRTQYLRVYVLTYVRTYVLCMHVSRYVVCINVLCMYYDVHMYVFCIHVYREDNIKMVLKETKTCGLDYLTRDKDKWRAVMNKVMNFQVP